MNEPLCRALIRAGLSDEDVAARLDVDTKTVRRWLEGRMPYRRHRWALAALLGASDADLWPQLRRAERPGEVLAVYPRRDQVPAAVWLRLLASAGERVDVSACPPAFLDAVPGAAEVVRARAAAGAAIRISLARQGMAAAAGGPPGAAGGPRPPAAAGVLWTLRSARNVEIRAPDGEHYACLLRADGQLLVSHHAAGIEPGQCPVLHLEGRGRSELLAVYAESFEREWLRGRPLAAGPSAP